MQQVLIIPREEFDELIASVERLSKRVATLEKGLTEYVRTEEATRLTGLKRGSLLYLRKMNRIEFKYEGRTVLYLRSSLLEYNESTTIRRRRRSS